MSDVADKLREARALIERGRTQGDWAKDADGEPLMENDPDAVCWCASGAMFKVARGALTPGVLLDAFESANDLNGITSWNDADGRTQAEVIAAFDKAIELAEPSA